MASASTQTASAPMPTDNNDNESNCMLQEPSSVAFSVAHPRLTSTTPKAIRVFLRRYDQYAKEVTARALQLAVVDSTTTEPVRPVNLSYCADPEWLQSSIELDYIFGVKSIEDITDEKLRQHLESEAEEEKDMMKIAAIDSIIKKEFTMDMTDTSSRSRIKRLFTSYVSTRRRNGLTWVMKYHPKLAVKHLVSATKPRALQQRLEHDLELTYHSYRKDVKAFMKHAMAVAEAFQIVDNRPPTRHRNQQSHKHSALSRHNVSPGQKDKSPSASVVPSSTGPRSRTSVRLRLVHIHHAKR